MGEARGALFERGVRDLALAVDDGHPVRVLRETRLQKVLERLIARPRRVGAVPLLHDNRDLGLGQERNALEAQPGIARDRAEQGLEVPGITPHRRGIEEIGRILPLRQDAPVRLLFTGEVEVVESARARRLERAKDEVARLQRS